LRWLWLWLSRPARLLLGGSGGGSGTAPHDIRVVVVVFDLHSQRLTARFA
jgi:hypothetical protein